MTPEEIAARDEVTSQLTQLSQQIAEEGANPASGPETLFHYTTSHGLLGIVRDSAIWASQTGTLNDHREISYGRSLAARILAQRSGGTSLVEQFRQKALKVMETWPEGESHLFRMDAFVASFCADGDLLGQWAYFAREGGYSVGFRRADLVGVSGDDKFDLLKVVYDVAEQRRLFDNAFQRIEDFVLQELRPRSLAHQAGGPPRLRLLCASSLKRWPFG